MEIIEIKTLVDITNTNVRRVNQGTQMQFFQFRNWTTLLQCISLRSNIEYEHDPYFKELDIDNNGIIWRSNIFQLLNIHNLEENNFHFWSYCIQRHLNMMYLSEQTLTTITR
jgi:hypothetical protein